MVDRVVNMSLVMLNKNLVQYHLFKNKWSLQYQRIFSTFDVTCVLKLLLFAKELLITNSMRVSLTSNKHIIKTTSKQHNFFGEITLLQ